VGETGFQPHRTITARYLLPSNVLLNFVDAVVRMSDGFDVNWEWKNLLNLRI
jgi:hypothetical protein